jgi:hypothetical protein
MLLAASHSKLVYQQAYEPNATDAQLEAAYTIIRRLATRCAFCTLHNPSNEKPHLFRECQILQSPSILEKWENFKRSFKFAKGICYQCGIPQKVVILSSKQKRS